MIGKGYQVALIFVLIMLNGCSSTTGLTPIIDSAISDDGNPQWKRKTEWVKSFGSGNNDRIAKIAMGQGETLHLLGSFTNRIEFGPFDLLSSNGSGSMNLPDVYIVKTDALGNISWAFSEGNQYVDIGQDILLNKKGEVTYLRYCSNGTSSSHTGLCLTSRDSNGKILWEGKTPDGTKVGNFASMNIYKDAGYIVAGSFFKFGGSLGESDLKTAGNSDGFYANVDGKGKFKSAMSIGGKGNDRVVTIQADANHNMFLLGTFQTKMRIQDVILKSKYNTGQSLYVAKIGASGALDWAIVGDFTTSNSSSQGFAGDLAVDGNGNVIIVGSMTTIKFSNVSLNSKGAEDIFAVSIDNSGNIKWIKGFGASMWNTAHSVRNGHNNSIMIMGSYSGDNAIFDGYQLANSTRGSAALVLELDINGKVIWAGSGCNGGETFSNAAIDAAIDPTGAITVGGECSGKTSFGLVELRPLNYPYSRDIFLWKISKPH